MSDLLWITVPGGIEGGQAIVRVLIVPRLDGPTLSKDGMSIWPPPELQGATLTVEFAESVVEDPVPISVRCESLAQEGLWEIFFGPDTVVESPRSAAGFAAEVTVVEKSQIATSIADTYANSAKADIAFDLSNLANLENSIRSELVARWSGPGHEEPSPPTDRSESRPFSPPPFHHTISMLREHPAVLRALGLILELRFPASKVPDTGGGVMRVRWLTPPASIPKITPPWTQVQFDVLPDSTANVSSGMIDLQNGRESSGDGWQVAILDIDNGERRLREAARKASGPGGIMLPALRSAGLQLLRQGRHRDFSERQRAARMNAELRSLDEAVLTADDLILGLRLDVAVAGKDWLSLHERDATYVVSRGSAKRVISSGREEGHLKAHAATEERDGRRRTDEIVSRWNGWSLSVPRPDFDAPAGRELPSPHADMPYAFSWNFSVPKGSLPQLRFSQRYKLRARVADIAGGGLEVDDPAANRCFTDEVVYRRYEPIASPELALPGRVEATALAPAEAIDQIVIRSDFNIGVQDFARQNPRYASNPLRFLLVPKAPLSLAEQHGAADGTPPETIVGWIERAFLATEPNKALSPGDVVLPDFAAGGVSVFSRQAIASPNFPPTERAWLEPWPDIKPKQIELREVSPGANSGFVWETNPVIGDSSISDRLVVRLAKADEVTLELSSIPRARHFDDLAISGCALPSSSRDAALRGRHPMSSPIRKVTLTHAVRRPLNPPKGTLKARREEGQTFAILEPEHPLLGVDTKSTAKLEIKATWTEQRDDKKIDAPLQTIILNRGDQLLREKIRHEFGDTKHRNVTYTVSAVSRFRQFFDRSESESAFVTSETLPTVSIPSSGRPPPPVVLSTRPSFLWEEERDQPAFTHLTRRRTGGLLRVELDSPWYATGEGEQLAVLVWKDAKPPEEIWPFLTQTGADPIFRTSTSDRFPTAASLTHAAGPGREVVLPEAPLPLIAVPFSVSNAEVPSFIPRRYCFADIGLPGIPKDAYGSFVQLALARYQPDSLQNLALSTVVKTELVQPLPERTISIERSGDKVSVKISGPGPFGSSGEDANEVKVLLERLHVPKGMPAEGIEIAAMDSSFSPSVPAWIPVPDFLTVLHLGEQGRPMIIPRGLGRLRLRIQEFEDITEPNTGGFGIDIRDLEGRTVLTDVVELPII